MKCRRIANPVRRAGHAGTCIFAIGSYERHFEARLADRMRHEIGIHGVKCRLVETVYRGIELPDELSFGQE